MRLFQGRGLDSEGMIRMAVFTTLLVVGFVISNPIASASPRLMGLSDSNLHPQRLVGDGRTRLEDEMLPANSDGVVRWLRFQAASPGVGRLELHTSEGLGQAPRAAPLSVPGDERWSSVFGASALDDQIYALTVNGSDLYVGGAFGTAGGYPASRIAKWNGSSWSALGSGMDNYVISLATDRAGNLYAGGWFTTAGGNPVNRIAKWDGNAWSPLGSGVSVPPGYSSNADVRALAVDGNGNVYAGGWFTTAGENPANFVAKWNGNSWSPLGSGMNGGIYALLLDGSGNLYAAGDFTTAGGNPANFVAKWDGTAWSGLGSGMGDWTSSLAMDEVGNLYVAGSFTTAGGKAANRVAKWNGTDWSALGTGFNNEVYALATLGGNIYAGGKFTSAGGNAVNYIAEWDGHAWSPLGSGVNGGSYPQITRLGIDARGNLIAGGRFTTAGSNPSSNLALWFWPFASYLPLLSR